VNPNEGGPNGSRKGMKKGNDTRGNGNKGQGRLPGGRQKNKKKKRQIRLTTKKEEKTDQKKTGALVGVETEGGRGKGGRHGYPRGEMKVLQKR